MNPFAVRCLPGAAALALLAAVLHAPAARAVTSGSADEATGWREQARALEHGEGVARDPAQALALYCRAALAGDTEARYNLGWMHANGRGTERDDALAAYWFQLAADQGDVPARTMLQRLGPTTAKPPCVLAAEAAAEREAQARAEAAEAEAREQLSTRYQRLIANTQQEQVMAIVQRLAPEYGIHPGLAYAIIRAESNFDPRAVSDKNAQGLMQLIPETAARFRVRQPFDPEQNIRGGLAYLRWLMAYFQGQVPLVAAAYNAGEGTVERFRGVPPYPETRDYIRRIQAVFSLQQHPYDDRITQPSRELQNILRSPAP